MLEPDFNFVDLFNSIREIIKEHKKINIKNSIFKKIQLYFDLKKNYYIFDENKDVFTNYLKFTNTKRKNVYLYIALNIVFPTSNRYTLFENDLSRAWDTNWNTKKKVIHCFLDKLIVKECEKRWNCFSNQSVEEIKKSEFKYKISNLINA